MLGRRCIDPRFDTMVELSFSTLILAARRENVGKMWPLIAPFLSRTGAAQAGQVKGRCSLLHSFACTSSLPRSALNIDTSSLFVAMKSAAHGKTSLAPSALVPFEATQEGELLIADSGA
jgi:hypothetical protein